MKNLTTDIIIDCGKLRVRRVVENSRVIREVLSSPLRHGTVGNPRFICQRLLQYENGIGSKPPPDCTVKRRTTETPPEAHWSVCPFMVRWRAATQARATYPTGAFARHP
jgi:hypothetical protein